MVQGAAALVDAQGRTVFDPGFVIDDGACRAKAVDAGRGRRACGDAEPKSGRAHLMLLGEPCGIHRPIRCGGLFHPATMAIVGARDFQRRDNMLRFVALALAACCYLQPGLAFAETPRSNWQAVG